MLAALEGAETVIFQGTSANDASARAHLVLPSAAYVEREGTFTNFQGRVQRFRTAVPPLGAAWPDWMILSFVGKALGFQDPVFTAERPEQVFSALAATVPAFAGEDGLTVALDLTLTPELERAGRHGMLDPGRAALHWGNTLLRSLLAAAVVIALAARELPAMVPASAPEFVRTVTAMMMAGRGDELPVSMLPVDGTYPSGTTAYEKRNISDIVAVWDSELCIQCGNCSFVCPHSVIRSRYYGPEGLEGAPDSFLSRKERGVGLCEELGIVVFGGWTSASRKAMLPLGMARASDGGDRAV